jgi:hypothetical protein
VLVELNSDRSLIAIVETRGTNEPQGPSNSFKTMNANILAQASGGIEVREQND